MIRAGTQLRSAPLVPGIRLHLASDPIGLWRPTELTSGRTGLDPPFWAFAWAGGLALARYLPAAGTGLVLAGDAFYEPDLAGKVIRLAERGHARGAAVLVGDYGRAYLPRDQLIQVASYDVPGQNMLEGTDIKRTTIWALPGRQAAGRPA
jgi:predicted nicotinamide N-methyase